MWNNQLFKIVNIFKSSQRNLSSYQFDNINVTSPIEHVYHVELNNPDNRNSMNIKSIQNIGKCFEELNVDNKCRCIVLSGAGKAFSAGMDLVDINNSLSMIFKIEDPARRSFLLRRAIREYQLSFSSLETCLKPIIVAVHGYCIGGAVDLICSADVRLAANDSYFQIKEVEMGLAADLGTLQRFPKLVGNDSLVRELVYTSRKFMADEALKIGFISGIFADKDALMAQSLKMAGKISSMSPVAVQSSKAAMNYSRDHSADEALRMQADWNSVMLQSEDLMKSVMAAMQKTKANFENL